MTVLKAEKTIDVSGKLCPIPVVEVSKGIRQVEIGQVLKLIATDAGTEQDIPAWARQTGHKLLDSARQDGQFIFHIERAR